MFLRCLAILCLSGCLHVHVYTHGHVQGGEGLEPGDPVVARWHGGLYQGVVLTVQGKLVTVAWDDGSKSYVRRDWVALVGQESMPVVADEDWVLCNTSGWQICRATRVGNDRAFAPVSDGVARKMARGVVAVPPGLVDWVAEQGVAAVALLAAQEKMARVQPAAAGEPVRVGAKVLASTDAGVTWHEAEVVKVGDRVTVKWHNGVPAEVSADQVAPLGPADFSEGALVFCKWAGGTRWWRAEVTQLSASALTVTYIDGTAETLAPEACTPGIRQE